MLIESFASGSKGNAYYISDGETSLLLEAGLRPEALKNLLWQNDIMLTNIDGCLISHEHKDHSASAAYLSHLGIPILASQGTFDALNTKRISKKIVLEALVQYRFKTFAIRPFPVEHDANEPFGFLLQSRALNEKLVYATDTFYLKIKIPNVHYLMIEANYSLEIMQENIRQGYLNQGLANRIIESHFSIDHLIDALGEADLSNLKAIYLMHLSDANSNEADFKERVQKATGVPVYVC